MNKCKEAYETLFAEPWMQDRERSNLWQAAWNARGKVDAEICRNRIGPLDTAFDVEARACAEAIEKEKA